MSVRTHTTEAATVSMSVLKGAEINELYGFEDPLADDDQALVIEDSMSLEAFVLRGDDDELRQLARDILTRVGVRYTAHFRAQVWLRDQALEVDALGDQDWDCTDEINRMPPEYRLRLISEINTFGNALDGDDWLKHDPNAPAWVQEWPGPFDIHIRRTDSD